jgi:hypothetical protein
MAKNVATFEEFIKMGTSPLVDKHYSGEKDGKAGHANLHEQDPKNPGEKGNGKADHTEAVKADDLSDPKNADTE